MKPPSSEPKNEEHLFGKQGEDLAAAFLVAKGYTIFDRNYRYFKGEIDIIAFQNNVLHFVEVKTRKNADFNIPEIVIGKKQQAALAKTGSFYIWERKLNQMPAVFDVLCVNLGDVENPVFLHYEDALKPNNPYF